MMIMGLERLCGHIPHKARLSLAVAIFYGSSSVLLALLNKAILSGYKFDCYFLLLSAQLVLSLAFCAVSRDYFGNRFDVAPFSWDTAKAVTPMAIVYVSNVVLGMVGLQLVNVPMFFCIRRLVAPVILSVEVVLMGRQPDRGTIVSVLLIVLGTILAGYETLGDDALGYVITLCNNLATAGLFIMQKRYSQERKLSTFSLVYYNALIALPVTLIAALLTGELSTFAAYQYRTDPRFWGGFCVSSGMGLLLTYSSMLCTTYNSPLATAITGNAKDLLTTSVGWILFGGLHVTPSSIMGLCFSFTGAFLYSFVGLRKQQSMQQLLQQQQQPGALLPSVAVGSSAFSSSSSGSDGTATSDECGSGVALSPSLVLSASSSSSAGNMSTSPLAYVGPTSTLIGGAQFSRRGSAEGHFYTSAGASSSSSSAKAGRRISPERSGSAEGGVISGSSSSARHFRGGENGDFSGGAIGSSNSSGKHSSRGAAASLGGLSAHLLGGGNGGNDANNNSDGTENGSSSNGKMGTVSSNSRYDGFRLPSFMGGRLARLYYGKSDEDDALR